MKKLVKAALLLWALFAGLGLATLSTYGTIDYAKKEKKSCTTCHIKMGDKELNDVGKCYKKNKLVLKGCEKDDKTQKDEKKD
jgi:hypothetical protein